MMKIDKSDGVSEIILEKFKFTIDPGTTGQKAYTFKGKGIKKGGESGNLYVNLSVNEHPQYKLKAMDVYSVTMVPLIKMIKGGEEEVLTLYGTKTIKIPPGTKPGDLIPIKKCGVSKIGKHLVEIQPIFPGKEGLQSDDSWNPLNINWNLETEESEDEELKEFQNIFEKRNDSK